ncbi:VOC family protein [Stenotrophomonas sp. 278]|uniref:VOC family protein n=1 Tax=Stenotrophomonas sp. 278 TaxID=2479851 RepID=UPI000F67D921|nr:VOC family protein [Stenotrophomonas sp. 278]RRU13920.1 glyoxalase [Stenotrophomonas sp. 278]
MTAPAASAIIPCLRYRDAHAAIAWLEQAFDFKPQAVYADGAIVYHAQLVHGGGMVMLGSVDHGGEWEKLTVQPDEIDGRETQSACVVVSDPDAHYARAVAAGAKVVIDIADQDYGGRGYACRDLEGHLWWFGSYDPWQAGQAAT